MQAVTFLDSTTINNIAQARGDGAEVTIQNPSPVVKRTLELCGLTDLIA